MNANVALENRLMDARTDNDAVLLVMDLETSDRWIIEIVDRICLDNEEMSAHESGYTDGYVYGNIYAESGDYDYLCSVPYMYSETLRTVLIRMGMPEDVRIIGEIPEDVIPETWGGLDEDDDRIRELWDAVKASESEYSYHYGNPEDA